ncbi:MAG TPA: aminotransferase class V-fold PLP-dependent enzyme [Actinomycetota bacterium]|nr:aminotransferase class V-fold PLP-dependent enzyme [Actinomycetota bacterium]
MRGPSDLLAWRSEFPAVERTVFLGSHTLAPASRRTRAAIDRFMDAWESKASAERVWFDDVIPEMRRLESMAASIIGADPPDVALSPSVTTAIASLASALSFDEPKNEIVLSRREFPTDSLAWLAHEGRGAAVVWVDGSEAGDYTAAISDRTAAVTASRVSYLDGAVTDAAAICAAAREAGALSVIDDFHGAGIVPVDVGELGCDALVFGPYKYLFGTSNVGILYVRPDVAKRLRPTITGWFAQRDFFAFDGSRIDWPHSAQRFALGTPAALSIFASAAGMSIVLDVGVARIRERSLELTGYLIERADECGLAVRTPREPARRGGLVAVEVPDSKRVLDSLLDRGIIVDERHGALRICPHFFNSEDDIDALFDALAALGIGG